MHDSGTVWKESSFNFRVHIQKLRIHRNIIAITSPKLITLNFEIAFTDILKFRYRCRIIHIGTGISQAFN